MVNGWLLLICPPKMVVNRLTKIGNSKGKTRGKSTCWCRPGMFLMVVKTLCFFKTPHKLGYSCGHIPSYTYKLYGTTHPMMVLSHPTIAGESGICKTWGRFQTSDSETSGRYVCWSFRAAKHPIWPLHTWIWLQIGTWQPNKKGGWFPVELVYPFANLLSQSEVPQNFMLTIFAC